MTVMPPEGSILPNLYNFKLYIGARSTQDDEILQDRLDAATEYVLEHTYEDHWNHVDITEAIFIRASRLYKRRQAPDGMAGFGGVITDQRVAFGDPDEEALIDRHRDWKRCGGIA